MSFQAVKDNDLEYLLPPRKGKAPYKPISRNPAATGCYSLSTSTFDNTTTDITLYVNQATTVASALIDTGCLASNFGSPELLARLSALGACSDKCTHCSPVCSAFGECRTPIALVNCIGSLLINSKLIKFKLAIKILPDLFKYDIIIGRDTIIEHNLISLISPTLTPTSTKVLDVTPCTHKGEVVFMLASEQTNPNRLSKTKEELLDLEDTFDEDVLDQASWWEDTNTLGNQNDIDLIQIEGSPEFVRKVRALAERYSDIFSTKLPKQPSSLPPLRLTVELDKWQQKRNRQPVRLQSLANNAEINKQVDTLLQASVLVQSEATEYSQTLIVPKPRSTKKRMCQDYRYLNLISDVIVHPMPNIKGILQRIGSREPTMFAVMDLTQGYHQISMATDSRKFTAFACHMGIFEYTRVPFGLKGAPAYFQMLMSTKVLAGLLNFKCECYLDDVIVDSNSECGLLANLEQVWQRFRKFRLVVNPEKTKIGLSKIEYVGHELDGTTNSIGFSEEKLDKVLQIPKPVTSNHLKSFLGTTNYFRDHIRGYADMEKPLQRLIPNYNKKVFKLLQWNPEASTAFDSLKSAINKLPKLHFISEEGEIHLFTDASNFGIGGYLCQRIHGDELPIAFVSQMLSPQQERAWSVPEKEAFAIYTCFKKLDYLIRDRKFTLHTDHRNLTFLNTLGSARVLHWKLAIQQYDFTVVFISGTDNIIADSFSRELANHNLTAAERRDLVLSKECSLSKAENLHVLFEELNVPEGRWKTIAKFHDDVVGHSGVERTIQRLVAQGHTWPKMRAHVKQFVSRCPTCQKLSFVKPLITAQKFTLSTSNPMECINIDSIGPLSEDQNGNKYIIVIIDTFSRWVELYPVRSTDAITAAKTLLHFVGRFGIPSTILSDNGTQFVNNTCDELTKLLRISHKLTTPYSHEENAIVERANREVMRHLRAIMFDRNITVEWSDMLPLVQRIMNASNHESIGTSPASILFGNAVKIDRGLFVTETPDTPERASQHSSKTNLSQWMDNMLSKQAYLIRLAQDKLAAKDETHLSTTTTTSSKGISEFVPGQYVLREYPDSRFGKHPPNKLLPNRQGPFLVVNCTSSIVTIQNLVTKKNSSVHISQLVPYHTDDHFDPRVIAGKDYQLFDVDHIVKHKGNVKSPSTLQFLVHWKGYEHSEDSWEPWKNMRLNAHVHNYLRNKKLEHLIPPNVHTPVQPLAV
jgi:hypothetical protein